MATLPTAAMLDRPTPQARQSVASYTPRDGQGLQTIGKSLSDAGMLMQEQQDDLDAAHVGSEFTVAYANRLNALNEDQDYKTMPERYTKDMNATKEQLLSDVSNPSVRAKLSARLDGVIAGGLDNVFAKQRQKQSDYIKTDIVRTRDELLPLATSAKTPADFDVFQKSYNAKTEAAKNTGSIDGVEQYNLDKEFKSDAANNWFLQQPANKQLEIINKATKKEVSDVSASIPRDMKADTVKPYSPAKVAEIQALVAKPSQYDDLFKEAGAKFGVDPTELKLRAAVESQLNAKAQGPQTPYGQSGGLMQIETGTAKKLGITDRNDPRQSVMAAAQLLAEHQKAAGGDQSKVDKLYYAGSENNIGPNTNQYAENLRVVRSGATGDGFVQTGEIFDYMDAEAKQKIIAGKDSIIQKAVDNKMAENPSQFIADLGAGKYSNYLDAAQTEKYKGNAVALQDRQARQAAEVRIATNSMYYKDTYDKIQAAATASDPATAFQLVGDLRQNLLDQRQSTQFADDVRAQLLKTNPYSEEEKAKISSDIYDRFSQLKESTGLSKDNNGVTQFDKSATSLEDIVHLQQDMMTAKLSGVKGMDSLINKISPAIMAMAQKEQGKDDEGWGFGFSGWHDPSETFDAGYQVIQDYLKKQDKTNDLPLKSNMLQSFIRQADKIPEQILKDPKQRDLALTGIANQVISTAANKGVKNIPIPAISHLRQHPETSTQFDEIFGSGAANRILGGK